jgi:hypothetical protein
MPATEIASLSVDRPTAISDDARAKNTERLLGV